MTFKILNVTLLASSLILAACGNEPVEKQKEKTSTETTTEAPTIEKLTTEKATTEEETTEAPSTEAPTTEEPTTEAPKEVIAGENNVYGSIGSAFKEKGAFYVNEKGNVNLMGDKDNIYQAEKNFDSDLGLTVEMDEPFLTDHAFDFMEDDATMVQKISDNEFVYESKKLNKKYDVMFSRPDGKTVTRVIVSQHQE
ncbi:hypothetical protein [Macrococcus bovicus]|uniref:DUF4309 domain-containing protein n=1 Tax=Macrococcus bovicus TaxID=69968 RepID=A0A4R6C3U2_9STAP|nr:hypothetical protein [Macrococcus bovicus]TDM15726.1 hypothetical protein ERX55_02130 [Macrococcus bovicus]